MLVGSPLPLLLLLLFFFLLSSDASSEKSTTNGAPENIHPTCYEYETYCLFTPPSSEQLENVWDAFRMCGNSISRSFPFRPFNRNRMRVLDEYVDEVEHLRKASLIVYAIKENDTWMWTRDVLDAEYNAFEKSDLLDPAILLRLREHRNRLFYQRDSGANPSRPYRVVCMKACWSREDLHTNKTHPGGRTISNLTAEMCRVSCETTECSAWSMTRFRTAIGDTCTLHEKFEQPLQEVPFVECRKIDRSTKNQLLCLGTVLWENRDYNNKGDLAPNAFFDNLTSWIMILLLPLSVGLYFLVKKYNKKLNTRTKKSTAT